MNTFLAVFNKEVRDYVRDRRTLFTSLLVGKPQGAVVLTCPGFAVSGAQLS